MEDRPRRRRRGALSRSGRSLGHHHGDPLIDDHRRRYRVGHRDPTGRVVGPFAAGGSRDQTSSRRDADHPRSGLLHPHGAPVRHPTGPGHDRHGHLLPASGSEVDHPGHSEGSSSVGGSGGDVRLHRPTDAFQGAAADGDALHHDRGQSDDHDGPGHRGAGHTPRCRRVGPGGAPSSQPAAHRAGTGRGPCHRGGGDGSGPGRTVDRLRR